MWHLESVGKNINGTISSMYIYGCDTCIKQRYISQECRVNTGSDPVQEVQRRLPREVGLDQRPEGGMCIRWVGKTFIERDGVCKWLKMGGTVVSSREESDGWSSENGVGCEAK